VLQLEKNSVLGDTEIVRTVRAMVTLCSDQGRATLEACAGARAPEEQQPAWARRAVLPESGAELLQADALRFLLALQGHDACAETISRALDSGGQSTRRVAVAAIARAKDAALLDRIAALAENARPDLAETIAEALGSLRDPRAEPALLRLLLHESDSVRRAAAAALGQAGTIRAVQSLLPLTEEVFAIGLKTTAREAIVRIQQRLGDAEAGRLSLVAEAPAEGGVSIAPEAGALSVLSSDREKD
jgi:HEAT repeat protein